MCIGPRESIAMCSLNDDLNVDSVFTTEVGNVGRYPSTSGTRSHVLTSLEDKGYSGLGSGAVCVQGALRPKILEVGPQPCAHQRVRGGVPIEEVGTRQKAENARMSMS